MYLYFNRKIYSTSTSTTTELIEWFLL